MINADSQHTMLYCAPLQGLTEAPWRMAHREVYGPHTPVRVRYVTPFVRLEHGEPRRRDMADALSPLDSNADTAAQIIAADAQEFIMLASALSEHGIRRIDLNMGCPFRPQILHGRGSALILNPDALNMIASAMAEMPDVTFSVKMRLGVTEPHEWLSVIDILNRMPLSHITVHPRTAAMQYKGDLLMDEYERLLSVSAHPVVMNGEIRSARDIDSILQRYPLTAGIMAGRGLLARPSLFAEWASGEEWSADRRRDALKQLHGLIYGHYKATLCGPSQILMKIKPLWEYLGADLDHKTNKLIRKASAIERYESVMRENGLL